LYNVNDFYYAETQLPLTQAQIIDPWLWNTPPREINNSLIYPSIDAVSMIVAQRNPSAYKKKVDLLVHGASLFEPPWLVDVTSREIQTCEMLKQMPYPNVCLYRGVTVDKGRVLGLLFDRYDMSLDDMVR
jgi:hypothetical protein